MIERPGAMAHRTPGLAYQEAKYAGDAQVRRQDDKRPQCHGLMLLLGLGLVHSVVPPPTPRTTRIKGACHAPIDLRGTVDPILYIERASRRGGPPDYHQARPRLRRD